LVQRLLLKGVLTGLGRLIGGRLFLNRVFTWKGVHVLAQIFAGLRFFGEGFAKGVPREKKWVSSLLFF